MYIYEIPFNINKELCRLLDHNDDWKELAGVYMGYTAFQIDEIEQDSRRQSSSPSHQLLSWWGQQNHTTKELFVLLYRLPHVPAMRCLAPTVDADALRLLKKRELSLLQNQTSHITTDENANNQRQARSQSECSVPLPVKLMEQGGKLSTSGRAGTEESTTDNNSSSTNAMRRANDELIQNVSAIPMLQYEDLRDATNNWNTANVLGKGGFGLVYKAEWKLLPVAVKRLIVKDDMTRELIREMCLNQYRHDNILPLYGYSLGGPEPCLVYQLMAGGSLQERLRRRNQQPPLTWCQRYRIAQGVASGLQYLHRMTETPLIHGDIKPGNILLDSCTMPKIGDFGLARKGAFGAERTHLMVSKVHGTRAYLPEEYLRGLCLSPAVDVYSYGMVLLEMASGLPVFDKKRPAPLLSDFIRMHQIEGTDLGTLEDPDLKGTPLSNENLCRLFMAIGLHCTENMRVNRPTMLKVYQHLQNTMPEDCKPI